MHSSLVIIAALAAAVPAYAQGALWAQCGGIGFSGSTSCVSGACCKFSNEYYSQCVPSGECGSAGTTTRVTTTAGATRTTTTTSRTTTAGSSSTGCGGGNPNAVVSGSGSSFTASRGGTNLYSGGDYLAAINAALNGISTGQRVSVLASGSIGAGTIAIGAGKTFEVCGTLNAGFRSGRGAIEVINTNDVSIPYLTMTGNPYFGLRFSGTRNLNLGKITMNLSGGIAIRFDRDANWNYGVKIGDVSCTGVPGHCLETFKIDGLTINSVTASNVGECGCLIQESINVNVGSVRGNNVATGTGYATLRFANRNGRRGSSYAANVFVNSVYSRGGGRGIFCVSESGGAVINTIDLGSNGNNAILIENCYGLEIKGGTVNGGGEVRLAARSEFPNNSDIKITLRVDGTSVRESPCGNNITWNLSGNGSRNVC